MSEQPLLQLRVSLWKGKAVGWAGLIFFSFCVVLSWFNGQGHVSPWFLPFLLLAIAVLLFTGTIIATPQRLDVLVPFGRMGLEWSEVERIEHGSSSIVFFCGAKRVVIPMPLYWSGPDKQALLELINAAAKERNIEVKWTIRADCLFPKRAWVAKEDAGSV